jgi:4-amino-4-deoxy-L-arabinose transferase-like glycosyltransferase
MKPVGFRGAAGLAVGAFVLTFFWFASRGAAAGPWRIDEAHKLSETVYLRLLLERRFGDPAWFAHIVDRTNPPVGKYFFGLAALTAGRELPSQRSLSRLSGDSAYIPPVHEESESAPYLPLLRPARFASLVVTSLTAGLIMLLLAWRHSLLAATLALLAFVTNYLTATFAATAVFDPLLSLLIFASVVAAIAAWNIDAPRMTAVLGAISGLFAGLAFGTRLSGGIALVAAVLLFSIPLLRRRDWRPLVSVPLIMFTAFAVIAIGVNPYYWSRAASSPEVGADLASEAMVPARIASRITLQLHDLESLLEKTRGRSEPLDGLLSKGRFMMEIVFGDPAGLLLLLALGIALLMVGLRRAAGGTIIFAIAASAVVLPLMLWLPLAWPRYLLPLVAPLAALGGAGAADLVAAVRGRGDWR